MRNPLLALIITFIHFSTASGAASATFFPSFSLAAAPVPTTFFPGGGRPWPGVPFSSVKVYMYNLKGLLHGNHAPVKNGKEDTTIVKPGKELNTEQQQKLLNWLKGDIAMLEEGLSKCYIPHHAVIFYDVNQKPVAWMSMCFMCTAIKLYEPHHVSKPFKYNAKNEEKATKYLAVLKDEVMGLGFPVFDRPEEYQRYETKLNRNSTGPDKNIIITDGKLIEQLLSKVVSAENIRDFILNENNQLLLKEESKISAGGDKFYFANGKFKSSTFNFSGREKSNLQLDEAVVKDFEVKIVHGILIGMTFEDFCKQIQQKLVPKETVILTNDDKSKMLELHFLNETLQWFSLKVTIW